MNWDEASLRLPLLVIAGISAFWFAWLIPRVIRRLPWSEVRVWALRCLTWTQRQRYEQKLRHAGLMHWEAVDLWLCHVGAALACAVAGGILGSPVWGVLLCGLSGWVIVWFWMRQRVMHYQARLTAELPTFLDLLGLCLTAGLNLQSAVQQILPYQQHTALALEWQRWLLSVSAGNSRTHAFRKLIQDVGALPVRRVASALMQAEQVGCGLSQVLIVQAAQLREERLLQAERQALQAPVKMLLPLVVCFFPSTFMVLGFAMWLNVGESLG
jgi:tight adherence protein C